MREPNRKIILGSKYPTFSVYYKKGWNGIFSSDIDFDFVDFSISHSVVVGTLGNSRYTARAGKFLNTNKLEFIDYLRFRQGDPILFSDARNTFQLLDSSVNVTDWFFEVHHIHHFNGAIVSLLPLVKKLRIDLVGGTGLLWTRQNNYRYEELFAGIERIFKLGARRRLRVGVYGVVAESNFTGPRGSPKISFDLIDNWKDEWSF